MWTRLALVTTSRFCGGRSALASDPFFWNVCLAAGKKSELTGMPQSRGCCCSQQQLDLFWALHTGVGHFGRGQSVPEAATRA